MTHFYKSTLMRICLALVLVLVAGLPSARASQPNLTPTPPRPQSVFNWFPKGPPAISLIPSGPLIPVRKPSRAGGGIGVIAPPLGLDGSGQTNQTIEACTSTTVDLKVLVIVADPTDTQTVLPAIQQVLDYQATPYTVFIASPRPGSPTTDRLASLTASGCHGFFQGIILGNGQVSYNDPTAGWQSALTDTEWQTLWSYERTFSIRQITWYTFPTAEYGFNPPSSGFDTSASPISASYTSSGQSTFTYANPSNPLTIQSVWAYLATPLDSNTAPLLQDSSGNALVAVRTYPDGTQNLALTFDSNAVVLHNLVMAYGLVNWLTKGVFLGERHIFLSAQVDDIFIDAHVWAEGTPCGTNPEQTPALFRMTGDDLQAVINWQGNKQAQPTTQTFKLDLAFNGEGTSGIFNPDTLTPKAVDNQARFKWISHTYTHAQLDNANYNQALSEFTQNNQTAQSLGLTTFTVQNLVTPEVSGLSNPEAMRAAFDAGVRYLVSDSSKPGQNNPAPNIGIYNQHQPAILMIPRHPNNLFYNVTNPQQWVEEYNCIYRSFWGRDLTYAEIVENESQVLLRYVLTGDMDPWMFHETNLRAHNGTNTLLGDLLDRTLQKYNGLFGLPIVSPTMDNLGRQMAGRMAYRSAGVTASIIPGESITLSSQQAAVVPVTGLNTAGAESYGGQSISHISLSAGQTITIPLNTPPTSTPTPTQTPPASNTPTRTPTATNTPPASNTPTRTPTVTSTSTPLPSNTPTRTPTATNTPPASNTPTRTPTLTSTSTPLPSNTPTRTPTATNTPLPSNTPTRTSTATNTPTRTPTLTPTPTNSPPAANNDSYTMHLLDVLLGVPAPGVLGNDTDADGNPLTVVLVTDATWGFLDLHPDGSFSYTPILGLLGFTDSFTYRANDGSANSNVATVTIRVRVP